ncbi:hypothetical protein TanjilG_08131 [Lupinus angustifolius]|uniref:Uncharacterized protein n=1 Tax=Lupinus angustifolius TaxID=3871 RepID=A0A4P1RLP8_LUPAN|nr:hypothetical protein TanjilG_08131 [Lupinus angustifolius]
MDLVSNKQGESKATIPKFKGKSASLMQEDKTKMNEVTHAMHTSTMQTHATSNVTYLQADGVGVNSVMERGSSCNTSLMHTLTILNNTGMLGQDMHTLPTSSLVCDNGQEVVSNATGSNLKVIGDHGGSTINGEVSMDYQ